MHARTCLSLTPPLLFSLEFALPPKTPLLPLSGVKALWGLLGTLRPHAYMHANTTQLNNCIVGSNQNQQSI